MQRRILPTIFIVVLAALAIFIAIPQSPGIHIGFLGINNDAKLKQGLDLQGGIQFLLRADCPTDNPKCDKSKYLPATILNVQSRVNGGLGVSEAVVTSQQDSTTGDYYISVELPGLRDDKEAINLIGKTGSLQFIDTKGQGLPLGTAVTPGQYPVVFTGKELDANAIDVTLDTLGKPQIGFQFQGDAKDRFATYTQTHISQYLTIILDGVVIESATINSQIIGKGTISGGNLTLDTAQATASILRYGSLPLPLSLQSERQIDATLGSQAIKYSITAATIGLGLVILFMLLYYRLPGFVATLALIMYAAITVTLLKLIGVVLTLAGIAGVILSVGMAVDANILIFERIKEELRAGRTLSAAIEFGWKRAWPSIRDSNASTIITCLILAYFGSNFGASIIVGFATNLLIGVLTSMFTAVVVTRNLLNIVLSFPGVINNAWLFGLPQSALTVPTYRRRTTVTPARTALVGGGSAGSIGEGEEDN